MLPFILNSIPYSMVRKIEKFVQVDKNIKIKAKVITKLRLIEQQKIISIEFLSKLLGMRV